MYKLIFSCLFFTMLFSCKKETETRFCWQGFDRSGYAVNGMTQCDKTLEEMQAAYPGYWFYKVDEPTYCWRVQTAQNTTFYMRNVPQSMADSLNWHRSYTYTKVDCSSFCRWRWIEKSRSKITNLYSPTRAGSEVYAADSCAKLYQGRQIVVRETSDSIYTREFTEQW